MRAAMYVRVSTLQQELEQTIEQQIERLRAHAHTEGYELEEGHIFRDDGYSGGRLDRPALDRLRDQARTGAFDVILITAPDRLARQYAHQVLVMYELEQLGCSVVFLERPMSNDPNDRLLLQIRGAVAEYERALIVDRTRRGRLAKIRQGGLLPWIQPLYGYRLDPHRPRDPSGVRIDEEQATVVRQMFGWLIEDGLSLCAIAKRLTAQGVMPPRGGKLWSPASVRDMIRNPAYTGTAYGNRMQAVPPKRVGAKGFYRKQVNSSYRYRSPEEWVGIPVPAIISEEVFQEAQQCLERNKQWARRNNTRQTYLLRALVSCGGCGLCCVGCRHGRGPYPYYRCRGKLTPTVSRREQRCYVRSPRADALDEVVWKEVVRLLTHPEWVIEQFQRLHATGEGMDDPAETRLVQIEQLKRCYERQIERLVDAYTMDETITLIELQKRRRPIEQKIERLEQQKRDVQRTAQQQVRTEELCQNIEMFCAAISKGLEEATFEQRRRIVELLIERVIVKESEVLIKYVIPLTGGRGILQMKDGNFS